MNSSPLSIHNYPMLFLAATISSLSFSYCALHPSISFFTSQALFFGLFYVLFLLLIISNKGLHIRPSFLIFLCVCEFSILVNPIPSFATPQLRLVIFLPFVILFCAISSNILVDFKRYLFITILFFCTIGGVISNFMYMFSIALPDGRGVFYGIFRHSMVLGPIAGIGSLFCLYLSKISKGHFRGISLVLFFICLVTTAISGSRSAFIATLIGGGVFMSHFLKKMKLILLILGVGSLSFFSGRLTFMRNIQAKQDYLVNYREGTFSTRDFLWDALLEEIRESPFSGSGFCYSSRLSDIDSGGVEPGSSWLFAWSTLGLFGFMLVIFFFFGTLFKGIKKIRNNPFHALCISVLSFLMFHTSAEGYMFSAGNLFCLITWLTLGVNLDNIEHFYDNHSTQSLPETEASPSYSVF